MIGDQPAAARNRRPFLTLEMCRRAIAPVTAILFFRSFHGSKATLCANSCRAFADYVNWSETFSLDHRDQRIK